LVPVLAQYRSFAYSFTPQFTDWLPFHWAGFAQETRYTYRITPDRVGAWLDDADTRVRNDLRRAAREGLSFVANAPTAALISAAVSTYHRLGARPPFRPDKMTATVERLRAEGLAEVLAMQDSLGQYVAAALVVADEHTAFLTITGYENPVRPGATTLLIAKAIDRVLDRGLIFDFEGSMIKPIESFYRGFGGRMTPYFRIWRPGVVNTIRTAAYGMGRRLLGYAR
jgi:hypothetical protein